MIIQVQVNFINCLVIYEIKDTAQHYAWESLTKLLFLFNMKEMEPIDQLEDAYKVFWITNGLKKVKLQSLKCRFLKSEGILDENRNIIDFQSFRMFGVPTKTLDPLSVVIAKLNQELNLSIQLRVHQIKLRLRSPIFTDLFDELSAFGYPLENIESGTKLVVQSEYLLHGIPQFIKLNLIKSENDALIDLILDSDAFNLSQPSKSVLMSLYEELMKILEIILRNAIIHVSKQYSLNESLTKKFQNLQIKF